MTTAPVVSVITPFLNAAPFIEESIESVRGQTFAAWELILVDDGSSDASTAIARAYASREPERIHYIEHPGRANLGTSAAINAGLRHARGRFIALIDADDVWLPHKLQEQVELLDAHPEAGMLYGNSLFWRSWTGSPDDAGHDFAPALGVPPDTLSTPPDLLARCLRGEAAVPCPCSVLMRRDVVERVGGFEEAFRVTFSDQAFYTKMFLAAPVYVAGKIWDKYRIHPRSAIAVAKRDGTLREERRLYLAYVMRYLTEHGAAEGPAWRAARTAAWRHRYPQAHAIARRARRAWPALTRRVNAGLPDDAKTRLRRLLRPAGGARFGNMRRVTPLSRHFGFERGQPVDRHFIEMFLARQAADIQGRVLEVGDDAYTRRYGGDRVARRDVLHVQEGHPQTTFVGDLADGANLPSDAFDCIILTQTLHLIFDLRAAVATLYRILKPGGIVLATAPGISQVHGGQWADTWYWSVTPAAARRLFAEAFDGGEVEIGSHGNVLAASAFLYGLSREELSAAELAANDPMYPLIVTVRARKPLT